MCRCASLSLDGRSGRAHHCGQHGIRDAMEQLLVHSSSLLNHGPAALSVPMLRLVLIGALLPVEPALDEPRPTPDMSPALPVALVLSASVAEQYQEALAQLGRQRQELQATRSKDRVEKARALLLST